MKRKLFGFFTAGAVTVSLASCGGLDYSTAEYRVADTAIAENLNSVTTSMATDLLVLNNIGEGLIRRGLDDQPAIEKQSDGSFKVTDGLASSYTVSTDEETGEVTYVFTIRDGAQWENGDPITAHDFEFGWQQLANPANAAGYSSMIDMVKGGEALRKSLETDFSTLGAKASEDGTRFTVVLNERVAYFESLMAFEPFQPVHEKTWNDSKDKDGNVRYGKSEKYIISSGPYKIKEWNTKYGVFLEKNENYWDAENVEIESVSIRLVKNQTSGVTYFKSGSVDRVSLSGKAYDAETTGSYKDQVGTVPTSTLWYLVPNLNSEYTSDPDVREAISYALNLQKGANALRPYTPASYFVPRGLVTTLNATQEVDFRDWNEQTESFNEAYTWQDPYGDGTGYNGDGSNNLSVTGAKAAEKVLNDASISGLDLEFMSFNTEGWDNLIESILGDFSAVDDNIMTVEVNRKPGQSVYDEYDKNIGILAHTATTPDKTTPVITGTWDLGQVGWGPDYADPTTFLNLYRNSDSHNYIGLDQFNENSASWTKDADKNDVLNFVPAGNAAASNQNRIVTSDGKTAAQASVLYDELLTAANDALQAGNYDEYYNKLAEAEAYLLDNNFVFPLLQATSGYLLNDAFDADTIVYHAFGSDYSYKYIKWA